MNPAESSPRSPSLLAQAEYLRGIQTPPPDLVDNSSERFGPSANLNDSLKRSRLPAAFYSMELEWREHPVSAAKLLVLTNMMLGRWLVATFCLTQLVLAPLLGLYGRGLLSPLTYPLIAFGSGLAALFRFIATSSVKSTARWFLVPQLTAILFEWAFSPGVSRGWSLFPACLAISGVGLLADRVNTHFVWLITANLNLEREEVVRRRNLWKLRFNWRAVSEELTALRTQIRELDGDHGKAFALKRRAFELCELRQYPLGFLALLYLVVLLYVGVPNTLLVPSALTGTVALALRRPILTMQVRQLITDVSAYSFLSWFSWDPKQPWVHSPGMFRDGLYSTFQRLTQSVACFVLIEIVFVPPLHSWSVGDPFTPEWLWSMGFHFFLNVFVPVFLILCALISTGARPLWIHLAAIEFAEGSNEWN
jgi:hypothetical protein